MSISFTPSQLHIITLALTEAEFITGAEYTSSGRETLLKMFCIPEPVFPPMRSVSGMDWVASPAELAWRKLDNDREREFESAIKLVERAYGRFRKEFDFCMSGRCKLSVVRKYHGLLIDTLAPFTK